MTRYSRIVGTGSALPERLVTNADLVRELAARGIETSEDWIADRTGIQQRYLAAPDVTSSMLGAQAAQAAVGSGSGTLALLIGFDDSGEPAPHGTNLQFSSHTHGGEELRPLLEITIR